MKYYFYSAEIEVRADLSRLIVSGISPFAKDANPIEAMEDIIAKLTSKFKEANVVFKQFNEVT